MRLFASLVIGIFLLSGCTETRPSEHQISADVTRTLLQRDSTLTGFRVVGQWKAHNDSIIGRDVRLYRRGGDSIEIDLMYRRTATPGWKCWGFAVVNGR